ncbi:MAG: hypothetical protein CME70_13560 [Halobacteriovorax sp.]|nr:hypothetical protein [Halobacteriovorax sp.]|tara:strand:- start:9346 stop:9855 length:510 start_codon:yes stop_codon:yes gene_type:complete
MQRRKFLFGGLLGGALSSLPFRKKAIRLEDFGYTAGADNTESVRLAEAAAFLKGRALILPKNAHIKLSKDIIFRTNVIGNNAQFEALNSGVFIRVVNKGSGKQVVEGIKFNGNNISNGIFVDETKNVTVKNCFIENCKDVGISVFESEEVQLVHNQIEGTPSLILEQNV